MVYVNHYNNVIMSAMASQITSLTILYSTIYWGADRRKYQSSASLAFVASNAENVSIWWRHHVWCWQKYATAKDNFDSIQKSAAESPQISLSPDTSSLFFRLIALCHALSPERKDPQNRLQRILDGVLLGSILTQLYFDCRSIVSCKSSGNFYIEILDIITILSIT